MAQSTIPGTRTNWTIIRQILNDAFAEIYGWANPSGKVSFPSNNILQPTQNGRVYADKTYTGALTCTIGSCNFNDYCSGVFIGDTEPTFTGAEKDANSDDFTAGNKMQFYVWKEAAGLIYGFHNRGAASGQVQLGAPVLTIASGGQNVLNGSITPVTSNEGYEIYESATQNGTYTLFVTVTKNGTTFQETGLTVGSTRWFKGKTLGNGTTTLDSDLGTAYSGTTSSLVQLNAVNGLASTPNSSTQNTLNWTDTNSNPNETYIRVRRATNSGMTTGLTTLISTLAANSTQYVDSTASAGQLYYYGITVLGNGSTTQDSSEVVVSCQTQNSVTLVTWSNIHNFTESSPNIVSNSSTSFGDQAHAQGNLLTGTFRIEFDLPSDLSNMSASIFVGIKKTLTNFTGFGNLFASVYVQGTGWRKNENAVDESNSSLATQTDLSITANAGQKFALTRRYNAAPNNSRMYVEQWDGSAWTYVTEFLIGTGDVYLVVAAYESGKTLYNGQIKPVI